MLPFGGDLDQDSERGGDAVARAGIDEREVSLETGTS